MKKIHSIRTVLALLMTAIMVMTPLCSAAFAEGADLPFSDTENGAWYAEYVGYVYENGLMQGKGDGKFAPQAGMTRAEMATLLSRMADGYTVGLAETSKQFSDIEGTEWHADYVGWAIEESLLKGYSDGTMRPNKAVLRQEIVTIFCRFADLIGLELPDDTEVPEFEDADEIADYAVPYVTRLASAGIIEGSKGNFNPEKPLTRAEAAKIIMMFHKLMANMPEEEDTFVPVVRFAVVSDTHVSDINGNTSYRFVKLFESAYRYARSDKDHSTLDAIVVVGDLTNSGSYDEFETFMQVVNSVIEDETELVTVMGNHDCFSSDVESYREVISADTDVDRVVGGFHMIGISPTVDDIDSYSPESVRFMEEAVAAAAAEDPEKPIFTFQHHHIKDTVYVSPEWYAGNTDDLNAIYSKYPQVVNFSGHSHGPINDPTSIWQGDYTALGTGTLSYFELETGMSYGTIPPNSGDAAQYYIIEVDANNSVRILPYNILTDSFFRTPASTDRYDEQLIYYIDKPSDKSTFRYGEKRETEAEAPYFDSDAKLTVSNIGSRKADVTIPQAKDANAVYSYEIECIYGSDVKKYAYFSEYYFEPMPRSLTFFLGALKPETEYEVKVTPVNCFGIKGEPISTKFTTTDREFSMYSSENPVNYVGTFTNFDSLDKLKISPTSFCYGGRINGDLFLGEWREESRQYGASAALAPGKGYDGSTAIEISADSTTDTSAYFFANKNNKNTTDFPYTEYLRVWVDFTDVSFKKGAFGVITETGLLFTTTENTNVFGLPFWYMAEGESEWVQYDHSKDGFFGEDKGVSVKGFKGWLAFPTSDFLYRQSTGDESVTTLAPFSESRVVGVYMDWQYAGEEYVNSKFYIDEIALVEDFRVFEEYKG